MARLFTITLGLVLILSGTTTSAEVTFTLEEQFQKLSDNFIQLKENVELKDQQHNEMRKVLEEKITRLEDMMKLKDRQQVAVIGMPSSCEDLWRGGHTLSGLFSVMGATKVETVFCDFAKIPGDAGFQKWIGFTDVKSWPVYFYVQRSSSYSSKNAPIPFQVEVLNTGGAMNLSSGKFTAPVTGKYFFSFAIHVLSPESSTLLYFGVQLYSNGILIAHAEVDEANTVFTQLTPVSLQSTLALQAGDQVWVEISDMSSGMYVHDDYRHLTHFTGWILEQDHFPSL